MKVGLVYRGYSHDVVSRPGYNGSVSATSRTESSPCIQPDQHHPDDKDIKSKTGQQVKSVQDWSTDVSLKGWQYSDPVVTNFAQRVMAVTKLKEGRKGIESDGHHSGMKPMSSMEGERRPQTEIRTDDQGKYTHAAEYLDTEPLFIDESLVVNNQQRMEADTYRVEQGGRDTNRYGFYQLPAHLPLWSPDKKAIVDLDPRNTVTAPSQWDQKDYARLFLDVDELQSLSGNPEIDFGFEPGQAREVLRLHGLAQKLMTAEKVGEGTARVNDFDPENAPASPAGSISPDVLNEAVNGSREEGVRLMAEKASERTDPVENMRETGPAGLSGAPVPDPEQALLRGPIEIKIGPGTGERNYDSYGAGTIGIQTQGADQALKLKGDLARLNLALYTHHFGRDQIVPEDRTNRFQYDVTRGRRDIIVIEKPQNRYQVKGPRIESLPLAVGLEEKKIYSREAAPIPYYPSSKDEFSIKFNPTFQGLNAEDTFTLFMAPELDAVKYGYQNHPRIPRNVWDINSTQSEQEDLLYQRRLPFNDELDLDKEYGRPEFPSETVVVNRRSDLPFDRRNNLGTERERHLVPDTPIETQRMERHDIAIENVRKKVDNMKAEFTVENQIYGRDHSLLTEMVTLEEIKELDKFEHRVDYLEGKHTPPFEKGRKDMMPVNPNSLSLEEVVWGWNHKDQE